MKLHWPLWLYTLDDPFDRWFAEDKVAHWLGGALALCKSRELLVRWDCAPWAVVFWSWVAVLFFVLLIEAIEVYRYEGWEARGKPQPWPWLTDRVSLKDIAWGLLGAWMATL